MKRVFILLNLFVLAVIFSACQEYISETELIDERDGNAYEIVKIGDQYWMAENLRYKPETGIFHAYENDWELTDTSGYYYAWETAMQVCPEGWHLPTMADWDTLVTYLGGESVAGEMLRAADKSRWRSLFTEQTNSSGFSALPNGVVRHDGRSDYYNNYAYFWTAAEGYKEDQAWCIALDGNQNSIHRIHWAKANGMTVRCVRD